MTHEEAVQFLAKGVKSEQGIWLDLGAGNGTFSKALAEILPIDSTIYAIDQDATVLNISSTSNEIISLQSDFEHLPDLPQFDGILIANALHYVASPVPFLQNLLKSLRPKGSFLIIEYDMEASNPWVPFPIPFRKWREICSEVGLTEPTIFNERISRYRRGTIYAATSFLLG
jgi:ubiquinone/menaquinone biosynthesis C-methylase UbiE